MVGRLGVIAARQGLSLSIRGQVQKVCRMVAEHPERFATADIEEALSKAQTASTLLDILTSDPAECQRMLASLALTIHEAIRSLESSLSVRDAAKPRPPEGRTS